MSLTAEELALLAAEEDVPAKKTRVKKAEAPATLPAPVAERLEEAAAHPEKRVSRPARGTVTPVQFDDDGWGDLPVQMRG